MSSFKYTESADLVFVSFSKGKAKKWQENSNNLWVSHGVDEVYIF